jgi:hypothetical protein
LDFGLTGEDVFGFVLFGERLHRHNYGLTISSAGRASSRTPGAIDKHTDFIGHVENGGTGRTGAVVSDARKATLPAMFVDRLLGGWITVTVRTPFGPDFQALARRATLTAPSGWGLISVLDLSGPLLTQAGGINATASRTMVHRRGCSS